MNVVEVKGLSKSFHRNQVLSEIDFNIKKGSFTALLGKNGSGKSTILNILMGHEMMDNGDCLLFGESIKKNPDHLKAKIGHVSEKIKFDYPITISEFIRGYGNFFPNFDVDQFFKLTKEVNISPDKQFGEYSRGQKMQIVMLAALCQKPDLLLIDEITSVLDAYARNFFITLLKDYTLKGGTVVLTTNIVNEVQFYCTDVIFLSKSKIGFQTALSEIPQNFKKIRTKNENHPLANNPNCIWSGINSDGSQSFILPKSELSGTELSAYMEDKRAVTLEDLYIYHSQKDNNE